MDGWTDFLPELIAQIIRWATADDGGILSVVARVNKHWSSEAIKAIHQRLYAGLTVALNPIGGSRMEWTGVQTKGDVNHRGIYVRLHTGEELHTVVLDVGTDFFALDDFNKEWPLPAEYKQLTYPEAWQHFLDEWEYDLDKTRRLSDRVRQFLAGTHPTTTTYYRDRDGGYTCWIIDDVDAAREELRRVGEIARREKVEMWFV